MNVIKKTIAEVANEYNNNNEVDPVLLWDTIKMRIRSSALKYAKEKKAKMKSKETNLECDILSLQKKLEENNLSERVSVKHGVGVGVGVHCSFVSFSVVLP